MRVFIYIFIIFLVNYFTVGAKIQVAEITENSINLEFLNYKVNINLAVVISDENFQVNYNEKLTSLNKEIISIKDAFKLSGGQLLFFNSKNLKKLKILDLNKEKKYFLKVINNEKKVILDSLEFYTLSKEPTKQAKYLVFKNAKHNEVTLLFKSGNGEKRIIFVSKNKEMTLPKDGKYYKANSSYGAFESVVEQGTYCVYNGNSSEVKITGFEPEVKYYFRVFEYNGNNETSNYLLKKDDQNPRFKVMPLPPPVALPALSITKDGFIAKWERVKGAKYYELDVSKDKNFASYLELYEHMDIGDIDEIELVDLKPGEYYYRLRAVGNYSRSPFSNIIKVVIKDKSDK